MELCPESGMARGAGAGSDVMLLWGMDTFPARISHGSLGRGGLHFFLSQVVLKSSCLALLGSGCRQSITSTVSWASSALQGSEQPRGFWPLITNS